MKVNFKKEILHTLKGEGKTIQDIAYINVGDEYYCRKEKAESPSFCRVKTTFEDWIDNQDFEYNAGYGMPIINEELAIVFKDGSWLEREEYDGSEWFAYRKKPENENKKS